MLLFSALFLDFVVVVVLSLPIECVLSDGPEYRATLFMNPM